MWSKVNKKYAMRSATFPIPTMSSIASQSIDGPGIDDNAHVKILESGHIGFQLAEEVRELKEQLLELKQEKRFLLVNAENLEQSLAQANGTISQLRSKLEEQRRYGELVANDRFQQDATIRRLETDLKGFKAQYIAQKKKSKLLGQELERSLEDEVALRGYSRRLEGDIAAANETIRRLEKALHAEVEDRVRCQRFIEMALRSQLVLQKKLETLSFYCDRDADLSAVSLLDVSPDYLNNLLRDLRSDILPASSASHAAMAGTEGRYDFSSLEHRQRSIDHQQNQYLNSIRAHVSKLRKTQGKTRRYIRQLLDVIQTYEELPNELSGATDGSRLQRLYHPDSHLAEDVSAARVGASMRYAQGVESEGEGSRAADAVDHSDCISHHARHKPTLPSSPPDLGHSHPLREQWRGREEQWRERSQLQGPSRTARQRPVSLLGELQESLRRSFPV